MTQPIDEVYVDLHARGEEDAVRDVERAVTEMERDVDRAAHNMEVYLSTAFQDASRDIERSVSDVSDTLGDEFSRSRRSVVQFGDTVVEVFDKVDDAVVTVAKGIGGGGGGGGGGLVSQLAQMGTQLRAISALVPPPIFIAIAAAIPAVIALGGALLQLSGLLLALPAGIATMQASLITLKVAFAGVGDAVKALETGNLEKIEEAMKNLAPAAQAFAREVHALQEPLLGLRKIVQQAFFAPFQGDLKQLVTAALPTLKTGMADVAGAFGVFARELFELLGSNDILEDIGDVFEGTARIVERLTPTMIDLIGVFFGVIEHGMPFIERAFGALDTGLQQVTKWLSGSLSDGSFEDFLESGINVLKDLGDLAGSVFQLLGALFGDAGDEGRNFIQTLTEMVDQLTAFINSAEGQDALQRLLDTLPVIMKTIEAGAVTLAAIIVVTEGWYQILEALGGAVVTAAQAVGTFFGNLAGWVGDAAGAVGAFFGAIGDFFSSVGDRAAEIGGKIADAFGAVVTFLTELPGRALAAIQALPEQVATLLQTLVDRVAYLIGFAAGTVVRFFVELPERVGAAINLLIITAITLLTSLRDRGVEIARSLVDTVVTFFTELPDRVVAVVSSIIERVSAVFTRTRDGATSTVSDTIDRVVEFFSELPDRAADAVSSLPGRVLNVLRSLATRAYEAGRDMLSGLRDGIADAIDGAIDAARRAASQIVKGFQDALSIDSPSRVMADEVGKPMVQGIGVGVQDEVSTVRHTLDDITGRMIPSVPGASSPGPTAAGQVVTFDAGAVQVIFEGVVPSEAEALRTGESIGRGIARTIARRDVRTLVRVT